MIYNVPIQRPVERIRDRLLGVIMWKHSVAYACLVARNKLLFNSYAYIERSLLPDETVVKLLTVELM